MKEEILALAGDVVNRILADYNIASRKRKIQHYAIYIYQFVYLALASVIGRRKVPYLSG